MRRLSLVLASLLAMALVLWLVFADGAPPAGGSSEQDTVVRGAPRTADRDQTAHVPVRTEASPAVRTELKPEKAVIVGHPGGPPPDPGVYGQVSRGGFPVRNREVHVLGKSRKGALVVQVTNTDDLGQYGFAVPGGAYRVRVAWDQLTQVVALPAVRTAEAEDRLETAAAHKVVEVKDQQVPCDLVLLVGSVHVTAFDARTRLPLAKVEVALTWDSGIDLTGHTNADGQLLAADLPAGACTVSLALRGYRAPAALQVDTSAPCPEEREVLLEPACILDLRVHDERGKLIPAEEAPRIEVVNALTGAVTGPRRFRPSHGRKQPAEVQFDNLEEGQYAVRIADQYANDNGEPTVRFESATTLAPLLVPVVPGRVAKADLVVRFRGYVELRGEPRDHRGPSPALRVERVDAEAGVQRVIPVPRLSIKQSRPPQFEGSVAEGMYWLTFTGPLGEVHRETLQVADKPIRRSFKLPW